MKTLLILTTFLFSFALIAETTVPSVSPKFETTPVPTGKTSSDDTAFWLHPKDKSKSLIIGVNKNKKKDGGNGGLGIYNLQGEELEFFYVGALNNVDIIYDVKTCKLCKPVDIAVASNREKHAISVFKIDKEGKVSHLNDVSISLDGAEVEPYGLCAAKSYETKGLYTFIPQKDGHLLQYELKFYLGKVHAKLINNMNIGEKVTPEQDQFIKDIIWKDLVASGEEEEYEEKLQERFQMEGCVADEEYNQIYVGMERLGIFKVPLYSKFNYSVSLVAQIRKSKFDDDATDFSHGVPRLTDDIEGLSLYRLPNGKGYLVASVQGINEYALFDRYSHEYLGSFNITGQHGIDGVTETDGIEILSTPLGDDFENGIMIVHDDENLGENGEILNGNYKVISFKDVLDLFPNLEQEPSTWNPRR